MNAQKDQIQSLVTEIDRVLSKAGPRLPWVMSGEAIEQRQLLERIRNYLASLQQWIQDDRGMRRPEIPGYGYPPQPYSDPYRGAGVPGPQQDAAQQILQAVVQEMGYLRSSLTQPLQAELDALRLQRENLLQEIRQLETRRQNYAALPEGSQPSNQQQMIADFLQALMSQLQERLAQQVAEALLNAETRSLGYEAGYASASLPGGNPAQPLLHPAQRVEHLQALQARSDQLLLSLDSTLSTLFEALNRNVQSYQDSLSQGIDRMHSLGNQGEVMFTALVNHLAQQLGREASSFMQAAPPVSREPHPVSGGKPPLAFPLPPRTDSSTTNSAYSPQKEDGDSSDFKLPYPGIELPSLFQTNLQTPLIAEDNSSLKDLDLEELDLSDLNLDEPDLTLLDQLEDDSTVDPGNAVMEPLTYPPSSTSGQVETTSNTPATSDLVTNVEPTQQQVTTDDIDSALEFLEQLSASLQEPSPPSPLEVTTLSSPNLSLESVATRPPEDETELEPDLVNNTEVIDEFYNSLFGSTTETTLAESSPPIAPSQEPLTVIQPDTETRPTTIQNPPQDLFLADSTETDSSIDRFLAEPSSEPGALDVEPIGLEDLFGAAEPLTIQTESPETSIPPEAENLTLETLLFFEEKPATSEEPTPATRASSTEPPSVSESPDVSVDELFELISPSLANSLIKNLEVPGTGSSSPTSGSEEPELTLANLLGEDATSTSFESSPSHPSTESVSQTSIEASSEVSGSLSLDDTYIPAAPDENLLATNDTGIGTADLSLIDANTLQQLSEDLYNLEGSDNPAFAKPEHHAMAPEPLQSSQVQANQPNTTEDTDSLSALASDWDSLTLNDFAEDIPTSGSGPTTPKLPIFPPAKPFPTSAMRLMSQMLPTETEASPPTDSPSNTTRASTTPTSTPTGSGSSEAPNLTLDNLDDLFGDLPPTNFPTSGLEGVDAPNTVTDSTAGTLDETLEDVFADFPGTPIATELDSLEDVFDELKKNL